jgi:hypothetical protein
VQIGAAQPAQVSPLQPLGHAAGPQLQPLGGAPLQPLGGFPAQPMPGFPGQQSLPQHDPFAALGPAAGFAPATTLHSAPAKPAPGGPNIALIAGIGGGVAVLLIVIVAVAMSMGGKPVATNPSGNPTVPGGPTVPTVPSPNPMGGTANNTTPNTTTPVAPAAPQVKPIEFTPLPELQYATFPAGWKMRASNFSHSDLCPDHFVASDQGYYVGSLATGEQLWKISSDPKVAHYPPEKLMDSDHVFYRQRIDGGKETIAILSRAGEALPLVSFGRYTQYQLMRNRQVAVLYKQGPDDEVSKPYPYVLKVFDVDSQKKKWDLTIPRPTQGIIWDFVMYPHADAGALITGVESEQTYYVSPLHLPDLQPVAKTAIPPPSPKAGLREMRATLTPDGSQIVMLMSYTTFGGATFGPVRLVTLRTDNAAKIVDCVLEADWGEPFLFEGGPQLIPPNRAWMIRDKREVRVYDYASGKRLLTGPRNGVYIGDGNTFLVMQKDGVAAVPIPWDRMEQAKAGGPPVAMQW